MARLLPRIVAFYVMLCLHIQRLLTTAVSVGPCHLQVLHHAAHHLHHGDQVQAVDAAGVGHADHAGGAADGGGDDRPRARDAGHPAPDSAR